MASRNRTDELARLKQLDSFIRDCLELPSLADGHVIRTALMQRQDKLFNWYENRRREIGKGE